ncbi:MAG: type I methionyl aminopeptidase [Spirochaetaceae bacterium]|jgi:methionyl aminopeptidase|nr:type I methionyl aminopeptidase [Spirochaetaceae bacterium]
MIRLKNQKQIDGIRRSCKLLAAMYREIIPRIQAGMTTADIDELCTGFIAAHGGVPAWHSEGFPGAACVSVNNEVIHGIPSKRRKIHSGDIVSLDVGINLEGYISDSAVTIPVGEISDEAKRLISVTEECLSAGIGACRAGNRIADISSAVYEVAKAAGFGVVTDFCGHGVGLKVHEDPQIPNRPGRGPNPRIQQGMVLAIEPMINLGTGDVRILDDDWTVVTADGRLSAHAEHTVAVFEDHTEILTIEE